MLRREFITLLGGAAAAWPLTARAQQAGVMRRIGVLLPAAVDDSQFQTRVGAFLQELALAGWTIGRNVHIDTRWATPNRRRNSQTRGGIGRASAGCYPSPRCLATRTVPVVFAVVTDPVAAGLVDSLARPGGNATGFMDFEYGLSGKWLELLKQIAPSVTRVVVLRDAAQGSGTNEFAAIQGVAPLLRVEVNPVNVRDAGEIERAVPTFAHSPNGG
jgi:putative ABC transport system substrate-binding protein